MVQPPDAEPEQDKIVRGKLLPFAVRDGDGQGNSGVEEQVPEGIQGIEREKDLHLPGFRLMSFLDAGMLEDGQQFIVHGVVEGQILILLPGRDVLRRALAEPLAVGFGEEHMHLVVFAVRGGEGAASQGVGAAGAGTAGIDAAAGGGDKRTTGVAVIHHAQENLGKTAVLRLFDEDVLIEKGRGGKPQMFAQAENIVWTEGKVQLPAAVGKAGDAGMATEPEGLVRGQGADMLWGEIGPHGYAVLPRCQRVSRGLATKTEE